MFTLKRSKLWIFSRNGKNNIVRDWNISEVLGYAREYNEIEIKEPIKVNDVIYIVKYSNHLIFFVKESNWKKYIGVRKVYLEESTYNTYYKSSDLKKYSKLSRYSNRND